MYHTITIEKYLEMSLPIDDTPFWGEATIPEDIVKSDFQDMLTAFIGDMYGTYHLRSRYVLNSPEAILDKVQKACDNVYRIHAYTYHTLYETTVAEYNPIENYSMKEHEKTENSGEDKTTKSLGGHTDTTNYGSQTLTDTYGSRDTNRDTSGDVAPFESQSYQHVDKGNEHTVQQSATDKHEQNAREDSTTYGSRTDKDVLEHGHEIERDLTRSGNIGTLTTQEMLESERMLGLFNLVRIVANDIIHSICICVEGV